uniref:HECT-type E3 ubiquitin transferase n=1 Tax=Heterorhabditis bacteriophora TaxID=37862 RepID=A0A1I7X280_HETBA
MNEILAVKLQALVRGYLARRKFKTEIRVLISKKFADFTDLDKTGKELLRNEDVLKYGRLELQILDFPEDMEIFIQLCRHLILSMDSPKKDTNFAAMFLSTKTIAEANRFIGNILQIIPLTLMHITVCEFNVLF